MSYKQCKTAADFNKYTLEERLTRCGYTESDINQSGAYQSTKNGWRDSFIHTKQNTCRNKGELKEVLTCGQVEVLRKDFCEELQMTDTLVNMRNQMEGEE